MVENGSTSSVVPASTDGVNAEFISCCSFVRSLRASCILHTVERKSLHHTTRTTHFSNSAFNSDILLSRLCTLLCVRGRAVDANVATADGAAFGAAALPTLTMISRAFCSASERALSLTPPNAEATAEFVDGL